MKHHIRYTILLIACCSSISLYAQQLAFRHFGINEGLPHSELYSIHQDPDKTLWISTDNGLSHYDGTTFRNYNPKNVTGSNFVLDAALLPDDRLLVNSYREGLCFLEKDTFVKAKIINNGWQQANEILGALYTLTYDTLNRCVWAITAGHALIRLTIQCNTITMQQYWKKGPFYWVQVDMEAKTVYIGSATGLMQYHKGDLLPLSGVPNGNTIHKILPFDKHNLLLATDNSLLLYNKQQNTVQQEIHFAAEGLNYTYFMYDTVTKLCWIPGLAGGVKVFPLQQPKKLLFNLLPEVNVNYLLADDFGNIWCCSYGSGLFQFPQLNIVNFNAIEGLKDNYITHISGGNPLNIACLKSFYQFDTLNNQFNALLETAARKPHNKNVVLPNGDLGFLNSSTLINKKGQVLFDYKTVLYDAVLLQKDTLLLSGFAGLIALNKTYQTIDSFKALPQVSVYKILVTGDSILLATRKGVFVRSHGKWTQYTEKNGLPDDHIHDLKVVNGQIYVASRSGMAIIDQQGHIRTHATIATGGASVVGLAVDDRGGIWMATGNGLLLDYKGMLYQFNQYDGLVANDVTEVYATGNRLYAGTTQGLSIINLAAIYHNIGQPQPCFMQVAITALSGTLKKVVTSNMLLEYDENDIQVNISGPDFYQPQQRLLEYSMDDGQSWLPIINHQVNLQSLGYGSYHLQIRTKLRNELQYRYLADFRFRIKVPWYGDVFFIVSMVLLLILLIGLLFLRRSRIKHKRAMEQLQIRQQVLDLKQKAMAALLNPHFVFNSINSINYYIHNGEEEKYTRLLTDLSRLIRLNLNNTYQDRVTLASELEIIELYVQFEKHRFVRYPLDFAIEYNSQLPANSIQIPSMMLQPFVENAIWHGVLPKQGGRVWLTVTDAPDNYVQITVQDDGNGCDPAILTNKQSDEVRGVGLIQERIQAYNRLRKQPIQLQFIQKEKGFSVCLLFPLTENNALA